MLKIIGGAAVLALILAVAAYTKPSRDDLHAAATQYADNATIVGSVATRVTSLFGNDTFDDYIVFDRYRVYVGNDPKIECYGMFGKTSCSTKAPEKTAED